MYLLSFSGRYPRSGDIDLFIMRNTSNLLIIDGGTVKTNEEGLVEGLGIVFGSEEEPDQSSKRDFFTKDSFIRKKESFSVPLYYEHGLGAIDVEIGEATLTKTDQGWKANAVIDTSDELGKKVYEAVKEKPHGFSTGALEHLVKREARSNNTNFLKQWVVGEISLTERPAERKAVVESVKSVNGEIITEDAWESIDEKVAILLYDAEGNQIWAQGDETKNLSELNPAKVELKYVSGSVEYRLSMGDEDSGIQTEVHVYEWGGVENFITHLQNVLNTAAMNIKSEQTPEDKEESFEERVNKLITEALTKNSQKSVKMEDECDDMEDDECDEEDEDCMESEMKKQLELLTKELADLKSELSDREDALTKAKEDIARLEILAGAKEIITTKKGK